ncbi:MAG: DUF6249 domain-containing protein [Paludibacteraceae bacterium]|nr:DUF6249 domain-containing protein [Paludibacteraceae bacterium]
MEIVPICGILMPVLLVFIVLWFSHKKEQERNRLIEKMIEKGEDPEHIRQLLNNKKEEEKSPTKHFKSGITLLTIGIGLMVSSWVSYWSTVGIGAFIAIIGLGELAVAWYLRKYSK